MVPVFPIRIVIALMLILSLVGICHAVQENAKRDLYIRLRGRHENAMLVLHNKNKSKAIRATIRFTPGCGNAWERAYDLEAGGSRDLINPTGITHCMRPTDVKIVGARYY